MNNRNLPKKVAVSHGLCLLSCASTKSSSVTKNKRAPRPNARTIPRRPPEIPPNKAALNKVLPKTRTDSPSIINSIFLRSTAKFCNVMAVAIPNESSSTESATARNTPVSWLVTKPISMSTPSIKRSIAITSINAVGIPILSFCPFLGSKIAYSQH